MTQKKEVDKTCSEDQGAVVIRPGQIRVWLIGSTSIVERHDKENLICEITKTPWVREAVFENCRAWWVYEGFLIIEKEEGLSCIPVNRVSQFYVAPGIKTREASGGASYHG